MLKQKRARNLAVLAAVFALTAGASLAQGQPAKATSLSYAESVYRQASLGNAWCITADGSSVGSTVVLGKCAGATTQLILPVYFAAGVYELKFQSSGLCITYPNAQGHADGVKAVQGSCVNDRSQHFLPGADTVGDVYWSLTETDNHNNPIAIDDAGGVLRAYNPIDSSYVTTNGHFDNTVASEDFGGPDCLPNQSNGGTTNC